MTSSSAPKRSLAPVILALFTLIALSILWLLRTQGGPQSGPLVMGVITLGALTFLLFHVLSRQARDAEHVLHQNERYIEAMAELSQDIHSIIDADTRGYAYLNPAIEKVLGYSPEAFQNGGLKAFHDLIHPDDQALVHHEMQKILSKENLPPGPREAEPVEEEIYRIHNKWGEWRWFRSRRMVFHRHPDGSPWEILTVTHDITEQRAYEAALVQAQEFESLGTLAKGVAHDLNNILMGIEGYAELGLEGPQELSRLQEALRRVQEASPRASHLCRQLLAYSGRGRIQIIRHDINDAVREGLPLVESFLPPTAQLVLELDKELPPIAGDPNQVRHALLNLVANALESLGNQPGEITIRTSLMHLRAEEPLAHGLEGEYIALEIQDTGQGMSEETLNHIFDPSFSIKHPGKGLGLLTVQWIAREHKGAVHLESRRGEGTRYWLFFPLAEQMVDIDAGDEGTPYAAPQGVILVVDDEPTVRSILRQGLEQHGYKVIEAVDGVEGFGSFVRHRTSIDAVLLDLTMPRMSGDEVFREIHKLAPEVPVILMSGYSQQEATAALTGQGLAGFLAKPCSVKEALAAVNRALSLRT